MATNILKRGGLGLVITVLAFFLLSTATYALPLTPVLEEADWRTGEIMVNYSNVQIGSTIKVFARQHDDSSFAQVDSFITTDTFGNHVTKYFENGQSVWYYVTQTVEGEQSLPSITYKITPPITAFIINWPDMLNELTDLAERLNDELIDAIEGIATPSPEAMADLADSVEGLKDAVGVGTVEAIGDDLKAGLDGMQSGMSSPAVTDDGVGTFTGGSTGSQLPSASQTVTDSGEGSGGSGMSLDTLNPDSGTTNENTIRIPYGVNMQGELLYLQLFTDEQMEKLKWLGLLYDIAESIMWIFAGIAFLWKFVPNFKV